MEIGDHLIAIASGYDRSSLRSPGHEQLAKSALYLRPLLPAGLVVRHGGGQASATFTPWIGILDPDETTSPLKGMYLVYIFKADLRSVVLTLNQGITAGSIELGARSARMALRRDGSAIRDALEPGLLEGLETEVDFGWNGQRPRGYAAGNIAAITYTVARLPDEEQLERDLDRFVALYQKALAAKRNLLRTHPGLISYPSSAATPTGSDPLVDFRPKSDGDYLQHLAGKTLVKTRRHETLVREYGLFAQSLGLVPSTRAHPVDLTLSKAGEFWLVEAKVVYQGNATYAVREALGQLMTYAHFLYVEPRPSLVALFTEPIGDAYVNFLESKGIASVWKGSLAWEGSRSANIAGLF